MSHSSSETAIHTVLFLLCPHFTFCRAWADFLFLIAHAGLQGFCYYKIQMRKLLLYNNDLALCFFVTCQCYWHHLQHTCGATLFSPGLQYGFILTAMIFCACCYWWVMMVQFGENGFWLNLERLIIWQLQGNSIYSFNSVCCSNRNGL